MVEAAARSPGQCPGGGRTHTGRILRTQHGDYCGLYLRLFPHRGPHQPHQWTMVDVISCHEPCHAATDRLQSAGGHDVAGARGPSGQVGSGSARPGSSHRKRSVRHR